MPVLLIINQAEVTQPKEYGEDFLTYLYFWFLTINFKLYNIDL